MSIYMALFWWALQRGFGPFTSPKAPKPVGKQGTQVKGHTKACGEGANSPSSMEPRVHPLRLLSLLLSQHCHHRLPCSLLGCCPRRAIFPVPFQNILWSHLLLTGTSSPTNSNGSSMLKEWCPSSKRAQATSPRDAHCSLTLLPLPKVTSSLPAIQPLPIVLQWTRVTAGAQCGQCQLSAGAADHPLARELSSSASRPGSDRAKGLGPPWEELWPQTPHPLSSTLSPSHSLQYLSRGRAFLLQVQTIENTSHCVLTTYTVTAKQSKYLK